MVLRHVFSENLPITFVLPGLKIYIIPQEPLGVHPLDRVMFQLVFMGFLFLHSDPFHCFSRPMTWLRLTSWGRPYRDQNVCVDNLPADTGIWWREINFTCGHYYYLSTAAVRSGGSVGHHRSMPTHSGWHCRVLTEDMAVSEPSAWRGPKVIYSGKMDLGVYGEQTYQLLIPKFSGLP